MDGSVITTDPERSLRLDSYSHLSTMMGVVEDEWARSMGWLFKNPKSGILNTFIELNHNTWIEKQYAR